MMRNLAKRLLLLIASTSLLLSGCWDRTELNELAITSATAMDKEKDMWLESYQVIIPSAIPGGTSSSGGGSQVPIVVYSTKGKTIRESVAFSYMEAPRRLFFAHNNVVIVSEKVAQEGLDQLIDLYLRNPEARETVDILVTTGRARTMLEQLMNIERIPGQGIKSFLKKESEDLGMLPNTRMFELAMDTLSDSRSALLPEILISGNEDVSSVQQLQKTSVPSKLRLGRAAVLKEGKLVGWLTREEALGAMFLRNKVRKTTVAFACGGEEQNVSRPFSTFMVTSASTKVKPVKKDGRFLLNATIRLKGRLLETNCSLDLIQPDVDRQLERQIQQTVQQRVEHSLKAVRKLDADVIGITDIIKRKYPKDWKEMKKDKTSVFDKTEVSVQVSVKLERVGLSTKSFKKLKEQ